MKVTKEQAAIIGEALVEQARSQELERKNAAARRVSLMYRFPELNSFEAWERPIIVAEAAKRALREKSVLIVWAISGALVLALAYAVLVKLKGISVLLIWLAGGAILAPMYFYRREVVRKYVRERANSRLSQSGAHAENLK